LPRLPRTSTGGRQCCKNNIATSLNSTMRRHILEIITNQQFYIMSQVFPSGLGGFLLFMTVGSPQARSITSIARHCVLTSCLCLMRSSAFSSGSMIAHCGGFGWTGMGHRNESEAGEPLPPPRGARQQVSNFNLLVFKLKSTPAAFSTTRPTRMPPGHAL
jgi:hypothetical protein